MLREAIRLRMVGKKNKSEVEEGINPEQPGQPKAKAKAKKSTAGKNKVAAGRGGNPVPPHRRNITPQAPARRAERARRSVGAVYYDEEEDDAGESDSANESEEGESDSDDGSDYEDDEDD